MAFANIITNEITNENVNYFICSIAYRFYLKKPPGFTQGASFYSINSHFHKPAVPGFQTQGFMSLLAR